MTDQELTPEEKFMLPVVPLPKGAYSPDVDTGACGDGFPVLGAGQQHRENVAAVGPRPCPDRPGWSALSNGGITHNPVASGNPAQYSTPALDRDMHGSILRDPASSIAPASVREMVAADKKKMDPANIPKTFEQIGRDLGTVGEKITHVNEGVKDCRERLLAVCNRFDVRLNDLVGCLPGTVAAAGSQPGEDGVPGIPLDEIAHNVGRMLESFDRLLDQIDRL